MSWYTKAICSRPWKWHKRANDHDGAIYSEPSPGHAYAIAVQPHYMPDAEWAEVAEIITSAVNARTPKPPSNGAGHLGEAYDSAVYLIDRYRHVHAGRPVRDLDEAEAAFQRRKGVLEASVLPPRSGVVPSTLAAATLTSASASPRGEPSPESLFDELSRLVRDYRESEDRDPTKEEAWNLIADCVVDRSDELFAALASPRPTDWPDEEAVREAALKAMAKTGSVDAVARTIFSLFPSPAEISEPARWKVVECYQDLPEGLRKHLASLENLIGDLDGKTICTAASESTFIDEGVIVLDDHVEAFNGIVAEHRVAIAEIRDRALEEAERSTEPVRIEGSPGPLYDAGFSAGRHACQIAIRALRTKEGE